MPSTTQHPHRSDDNAPLTGSNSQQSADGTSEASHAGLPEADAPPSTMLRRITRKQFIQLAAPLTALLRAKSGTSLLTPWPVQMCYLRENPAKFRLTYEFDEVFFHGADTALDEPLIALIRAGGRRGPKSRHRIAIEVEHIRVMSGGFIEEESALVISVSREADEEDCRHQIERMLCLLLRPGRIPPLSRVEREMLGRPVAER